MLTTDFPDAKAPTPPVMVLADNSDAKTSLERVAVETLLRTTALQLANGVPIKDIDGLLSRHAGQVSREGHINPDVLGDIIATVESAKTIRAQDWHTLPPDEKARYLRDHGLDPARFGLGSAAPTRGNNDGGGRDVSGGDGAKNLGTPVRLSSDYQILGLSSAESLQRLSSGNWGRDPASMPFVKAGVNFGTVDYLRKYDKSFTGKDVLKAAGDVKQLGFDVNDHRMIRDQALIRHYDYDPDGTFKSEKKFNDEIKGDENLHELWRKRAACTDPGQQKVLDAQIAAAKDEHKKSSGVHDRLTDPKRSPQAKKGLDDATEQLYEKERGLVLSKDPQARRAPVDHQPLPKGLKGTSLDRTHDQIARTDTHRSETKAKSDLVAGLGLDMDTPSTTPAAPAQPRKPQATKTAGNPSKSPSVG